MPELLELTHKNLGWPSRKDIMNPKGVGPKVLANLAKRKLKTAINQLDVEVEVGILAANPNSDRTEDPLAIVCEFNNEISQDKLRIVQRLAWSFSRSPMLITIEPSLLRVWTCWKKPPEDKKPLNKLLVQKYSPNEISLFDEDSLSEQVVKSLQWIEFVSGNFLKKHSKYFQRNQRADQLMLNDLKCLREKLRKKKLPQDICHDLIARVIFIEFLFQRKDSEGNAALNEVVLKDLHEKRILSKVHKDFASILKGHKETYRFFRELNERFNGDLFPGKGKTQEDREKEWKAEMDAVKDSHLKLLEEFVNGKLEISTGQYCLWRRYKFDVIPLEFISSIYEEFVTKQKKKEENGKAKEDIKNTGVHYTPGHLVDFILDEVLPWNGMKWDLKILDPACGSGIFLVKAYQRLVNRYKNAHGNSKPRIEDLRKLLRNNLFGIDIKRDAVRVASFSLYLAMCDEIDPKFIWQKNMRFPRLRDKTLIESDFFAEDKKGFSTEKNNKTYDLVIGNAPWGHGTDTVEAKVWAKKNLWIIPNRNIGPLFLSKAVVLTKHTGHIAMLQPAGTMLFNKSGTVGKFRNKFFNKYKVKKIINLSALRFGVFKNAISPACIVIMRPTKPDCDPFEYVCPKPSHTKEDDYRIIIEPHDINKVYQNEAANDSFIWTTLPWGGRRDLTLIRQLESYPKLRTCQDRNSKIVCNGFKRRPSSASSHPESLNLPILEEAEEGRVDIWDECSIVANVDDFPLNQNPMFESLRKLEIYNLPFLVLKQTWTVKNKRFKAVLVTPTQEKNKLLFSQSFNRICSWNGSERSLRTLAVAMNSILSVYYFLLTGARIGSYRPTLLRKDILDFPLPQESSITIRGLERLPQKTIDRETQRLYRLKDAQWILVKDLFDYTLQDFKGGVDSPGRQPTRKNGSEDILKEYCEYFSRVLKAGFGKDKNISATIFTGSEDSSLPVRLVAIHLEPPKDADVKVETIDSPKLLELLRELDAKYLDSEDKRKGGIFYRRVARIYDTMEIAGRKVPTVFLVKPDKVRYWTRSMALRDADEVAADIKLWKNETLNNTQRQKGTSWLKKKHTRKDAGQIRVNLHRS